MKEDSRATSPIPGMLSAKSLSRKRIFALQMSNNTAIKSHSRNNAVHPSVKSTHELTPNICRRRANAGGNRAGETFSSSSRPSPIHFEIFFREELRNWGQKKSKRLRRMIPHNIWEFGHYWLEVGKKQVLSSIGGDKKCIIPDLWSGSANRNVHTLKDPGGQRWAKASTTVSHRVRGRALRAAPVKDL